MEWFKHLILYIWRSCLLVGLLAWVGCDDGAVESTSLMKGRARYEQAVAPIQRLESLDSLLRTYEAKGDRMGIMIAQRHRGDLLRRKSQFSEALAAYQKELKAAESLRDTLGMMSALNNIGTAYRRLGVWEQGAACHYQGLSYYQHFSLRDDSAAVMMASMLYNGVGNIHLHLGNLSVADTAFRNSIVLTSELHNPQGLAINYANLGSIFEQRGEMDSAWYYFRASMVQNLSIGSDLGLSICHTHFGRMYEKEKQWGKASQEYLLAKSLLDSDTDRWHWLAPAIALCRLYIEMGKFSESYALLQEVYRTASAINSKEHLAQIYELRYLIARHRGQLSAALDYYLKHTAYRDSLRSLVESNKIVNLRVNHQRHHVNREMEIMSDRHQHELQVRQTMFWSVLGVFALSLIIIGLMAYVIMQRRHAQLAYRRSSEARSLFYANLIQGFRTPLTIILGLGAQLARKEIPMGESPEHLGALIHRQSRQLLDIANHLLELTKVSTSIDESRLRRGDVVAFTQMVVHSHDAMARSKSVNLIFHAPTQSFEAVFEPNVWLKIVQILTANAIYYTPENKKVEITLSSDPKGRMTFVVRDEGPGISNEKRDNLFDFFSDKPIDNGNLGTEISLSLVHQLVKTLDGCIRIDSEEGQGATFTIELPTISKASNVETIDAQAFQNVLVAHSDALESADEMGLEAPSPPHLLSSEHQPLVLVVEDHPDLSRYISMLLSLRFRLLFATTCEEGLEMAETHMPDLILTDTLGAREMDGLELCRRVRSSTALGHVPLVMMTGHTESADRIATIKAGVDAYLPKPFDPEELQVVVDHLLAERRSHRENYLAAQPEVRVALMEGFSPRDQSFLLKLDEAIVDQIRKDAVNVDELASRLCMSASQLRRKTLSLTGEKVTAYILRIRMGLARKYLTEDSGMSISEVASRCGFYDAAHFSKQFKQYYQMNPSQYRRRLLSDKPTEE